MLRKISGICLLFTLLLCCDQAIAQTQPVQLTNAHFSVKPGATRFVFALNNAVSYVISSVNNNQLTLKLYNTALQCATSTCGIKPLALLSTVVADYRLQSKAGQMVQAQFTFRHPVEAKALLLSPTKSHGYQLAIDFVTAQSVDETSPVIPKKTATSSKKITSRFMVVIDPGHGGKDPGATGVNGHQEKTVVLAIARELKRQINQIPGCRAELTRNSDRFIPLRQRLSIARQYKANLFIAVHADAYKNADANGASVFALSYRGATSESARWLAEKENQSEFIDGVFADKDRMLRSVLLDLSQTHTIGVSLVMGAAILKQLSQITSLHWQRVEQAGFVVLKSPDIPSLLIETGYLSNPQQEQKLMTPSYQQKIALAITQGIKNFLPTAQNSES